MAASVGQRETVEELGSLGGSHGTDNVAADGQAGNGELAGLVFPGGPVTALLVNSSKLQRADPCPEAHAFPHGPPSTFAGPDWSPAARDRGLAARALPDGEIDAAHAAGA
jgi:hypothetical protein